MSGLNKGWELSLAQPDDAEGIQRLFDDGNFEGGISVKFGRAPDPYQSFQNDGDYACLPVVHDSDTREILALGGCIVRQEHINGILQNTGYLTGLKIMQSRRQRINCIIPAYKLIREDTRRYNPFYYTTILNSNEQAIRLLEKRRRSMPAYIYAGDYTVFCLGTGGRGRTGGYSFCRGHDGDIADFYKEQLPKYNLSPKDEWLYGLKPEDFYSLRSPEGKVLAACALWNQQTYKQYIICGYGGIYKPVSYLPISLLGYPTMPKAGKPANYASIAALAVPEDNLDIAELFLRLVLKEAKGYDFVMLGLFENHPVMQAAKKLKHIKYQSRLYSVDYTLGKDETPVQTLDNRPVMLEVGLL